MSGVGRTQSAAGPRLIGRTNELRRVESFFASVAEDSFRYLLLDGEAGIGKTRLLREAITAVSPGTTTKWLHTSSTYSTPQQEIRSLFDVGVESELSAKAALFLSPSGQQRDPLQPEQAVAANHHFQGVEIARQLIDACATQPLVLIVDDLHSIDPQTLELVKALLDHASELDTPHFALVATTRPVPGTHPAADLVHKLERSKRFLRLAIGPLDRAACNDFVRSAAPRASTAVMALVARSGRGNPLRMNAAIEILRRDGVLDSDAEDVGTIARLHIPFSDSDPVVTWINALSPDQRQVLNSCSALVGKFDYHLACVATDMAPQSIDEQLTAAVSLGLLATDGLHLWFAHPQYREVLYDALSFGARAAIHERCANYLMTTPSHSDPREVGHHLLTSTHSGGGRGRYESLLAAGDASANMASWDEATRFFLAALASRPDGVTHDGLHRKLGEVYWLERDLRNAEPHLRIAIEESIASGDQREWAASLVSLLRVVNSMRREALHTPAEQERIETFLDRVEDPLLRSSVIEAQAEGLLFAGQFEAGRHRAEQALELARTSEDPLAQSLGLYAMGWAAMSEARIADAIVLTADALRFAELADDWYIHSGVQARRSFALLASGALAQASSLTVDSLRTAVRRNEYSAQALAGAVTSAVALLQGDLDQVGRSVAAATSAAHTSQYNMAGQFLGPTAVLLALASGETDGAIAALQDWKLPKSIEVPLVELLEVADGEMAVPTGAMPRDRPLSMADAAVVASQAQLACSTRFQPPLEALRARLREYHARGLVVPPSFPVLVPRLIGDISLELDDIPAAEAAFNDAVALSERTGAHAELVNALVGLSGTLARSPGVSRDQVHQTATRAIDLAERLGMTVAAERARGIRGSQIDAPTSVEARGGSWRVILATDLVGSTHVSNVEGDLRYRRMILEHHRLVKTAVASHGGTVWSDEGDSLYSWFTSTIQAVNAARQILAGFAAARRSPRSAQIKIALGGGDPLFEDGRPFGLVVNRTAHVLSNVGPDEILVDEALAASLPLDIEVQELEAASLKSIGAHRIFRLATVASKEQPIITPAEE